MAVFFIAILIQCLGFFALGAGLHYFFHIRRRAEAQQWKHQPTKFQTLPQIFEKIPLVLINSSILHVAIAATIALSFAGHTKVYWDPGEHGLLYTVSTTLALGFWYHGALFYVHKAMHRPALYKRFHHYHHKYKAPMFLDALYEHPVEAMWGAFVMTAPVFFLPLYGWGYIGFIAVVGLHEVLDHSGINLNVPLLSPSKDHDIHHQRFNYFYGQLLPYLDRAHKTTRHFPG